MSFVPVKLERDDVRRLDTLVKLGVFKNRSQAIRSLLKEQLQKKIESIPQADFSGVAPVVELMLRLASKGVNVVTISSRKSAADIVSEGRQRL